MNKEPTTWKVVYNTIIATFTALFVIWMMSAIFQTEPVTRNDVWTIQNTIERNLNSRSVPVDQKYMKEYFDRWDRTLEEDRIELEK